MQPYGKDLKMNTIHDVDKCGVCSEENEPNPKRARRQAKKNIKHEIEYPSMGLHEITYFPGIPDYI